MSLPGQDTAEHGERFVRDVATFGTAPLPMGIWGMDVRRCAEMYRVAILVRSESGTSFPDAVLRPDEPGRLLNVKTQSVKRRYSLFPMLCRVSNSMIPRMDKSEGRLRHGRGLGPLGIQDLDMRCWCRQQE
jgi:hypothetical protein